MSSSGEPGWEIDPDTEAIIYNESATKILLEEATQASANRITNNDLQGYDEIISISEESLNTVLRLRYSSALVKKKDVRLRTFHHAIPGQGNIKAELAAPHLGLYVDGASETVKLFINFSSGMFHYPDTKGAGASQSSQSVAGWSVAVNVNFSQKTLTRVPSAMKEKLRPLATPGSYSISQILLNLSAAGLASFNEKDSIFPGLSEDSDKRVDVLCAFKRFFGIYIEWLKTGPFSVLGYAIKIERDACTTLPPSFPPTAVRVRTQAYAPCTESFKKCFPAQHPTMPTRAGLDSIIFQEMTEQREWPPINYDSARAGNWSTGDADCGITLSRRVFWDRYLADKLSGLNMQILTVASRMHQWTMYGSANDNWELSNDPKPSEAKWSNSATGVSYHWHGIHTNERKFSTSTTTTSVDNAMEWRPGTDIVDVRVRIVIEYQTKEMWFFWLNEDIIKTSTLTWALKLRLGTIKAGVLEAQVVETPPKVDFKHWTESGPVNLNGEQTMKCEEDAKALIATSISPGNIKNSVSEVLNSKSKFVFPGAGEFALRDPKFSQRGDVMATLQLEGQGIAIDDDFHLQVSADDGFINEDFIGKWLKVAYAGDNARLVLVDSQSQATLFQISDGNLVVDIEGRPAGQRALTQNPESETAKAQDLYFNTPKTKPASPGIKLEFLTTGSKLLFSTDQGRHWRSRFILHDGYIVFYTSPPTLSEDYVSSFPMAAIY
ncbi:hypothetical protein ACHAPO_010626 [Fusarium lateritium]